MDQFHQAGGGRREVRYRASPDFPERLGELASGDEYNEQVASMMRAGHLRILKIPKLRFQLALALAWKKCTEARVWNGNDKLGEGAIEAYCVLLSHLGYGSGRWSTRLFNHYLFGGGFRLGFGRGLAVGKPTSWDI